MNRIQSKDHKIGTYEIDKISLPCFDDKIYIQNNGYDGLELIKKKAKTVTLTWWTGVTKSASWNDKLDLQV